MKIDLAGALTLLVAMASLPYENVEAESHVHSDKYHSSSQPTIVAEGGLDRLELNNGHKWSMDDHTRAIFAKMSESFLGNKSAAGESDGLKEAASSLRNDINELMEGCTMTGGAHDQLHIYLEGYIPAVEKLSESGQAEDAKQVRYYLENYDKYFK